MDAPILLPAYRQAIRSQAAGDWDAASLEIWEAATGIRDQLHSLWHAAAGSLENIHLWLNGGDGNAALASIYQSQVQWDITEAFAELDVSLRKPKPGPDSPDCIKDLKRLVDLTTTARAAFPDLQTKAGKLAAVEKLIAG